MATTAPHPLQAFLARIPLFAQLGPEDLTDVLRALRPHTMRAGEVLFRQDDVGDAAYAIETGAVEIRIGDFVVTRFGPGQVFGELALIDGAARSADAICVEAGTLHRIDRAEFDFLRRNLRPAAFKILRVLAATVSERLRETNDHIARALAPAAETSAGAGHAGGADASADATEPGGLRGFLAKLAFWSKS